MLGWILLAVVVGLVVCWFVFKKQICIGIAWVPWKVAWITQKSYNFVYTHTQSLGQKFCNKLWDYSYSIREHVGIESRPVRLQMGPTSGGGGTGSGDGGSGGINGNGTSFP